MSKVGNTPVAIRQGVTVAIDGEHLTFTGPKGALELTLPKVLSASVSEGMLTIRRQDESKQTRSLHGTYRSLVSNAVQGVLNNWEKRVEVIGTGFGVSMKGQDAVFKIGFSHPVHFPPVEGITFATDGGTILVISGVDRQKVGEVAYLARNLKKPDPYKGKGVRYAGEKVKLRPGKKTKTA